MEIYVITLIIWCFFKIGHGRLFPHPLDPDIGNTPVIQRYAISVAEEMLVSKDGIKNIRTSDLIGNIQSEFLATDPEARVLFPALL
jgi:hypothetical protein